MFKPSAKVAKIAVVALTIPLLGGFATYAAAQVSTKPAPQVVIPGGPGKDDPAVKTKTTVSDDRAGHDANDDKANEDNRGRTVTTVSDDPAGHDANDDNGNDGPGHDANDDKGHDATTPGTGTTPTTVDDHGGRTPTTVSDDPAGHDVNDDKGNDAVTPVTTTPTSVDDHGGQTSGKSGGSDDSGRHGSDG